jgi:putative ABC transport system ATP-binding protein
VTHHDLYSLNRVSLRKRGATVLHEITASIRQGACTAVVGPSGAGKTTLLRLLTRLEHPDHGTVLCDGVPLADHDVLALRRRVQFVAQRGTVLTGHVLAELRLAQPGLTEDHATELLAAAALPARYLHRPTTGLSGGETQRLCLARALAMAPEALILDEPTSALDITTVTTVLHTLREFVDTGGTVVLVSHDDAVVRALADASIALRRGTLDSAAVLGDLGEVS